MTHGTIEETYEYRIGNILKRLFEEERNDERYHPEELERKLLEFRSLLGELLIEDMFVWMSEEDWLQEIQS